MSIPGLTLCAAENKKAGAIKIQSFTKTVIIPESYRYGNCHIIDEYEKIGKFIEGSFSTIYRCKEKRTGQIYDMEKFKIPQNFKGGFPAAALKKINFLGSFRHPNILKSHGTVAGTELLNNYLLLDCCYYSLEDVISKKNDELYEIPMVKSIMKQLFAGLWYIHKTKIIHRSINPGNIKFDVDGVLKIAGFESVHRVTDKKFPKYDEANKIQYRSPELLLHGREYTSSIDMWAAGCIFAELLGKKPLFDGETEIELLQSMFNVLGTPTEAIWPGFDELLSQYENGSYFIKSPKRHNALERFFPNCSEAGNELIRYILLYFPKVRLTGDQCTESKYFTEEPKEYSAEVAKDKLQNIISSESEIVAGASAMEIN